MLVSLPHLHRLRRKNLFFTVDDEKIEFRFGVFKPKIHSFKWTDIMKFLLSFTQKKALLHLNDGSTFVINLNWLQKKKSEPDKKTYISHGKRKESEGS